MVSDDIRLNLKLNQPILLLNISKANAILRQSYGFYSTAVAALVSFYLFPGIKGSIFIHWHHKWLVFLRALLFRHSVYD
jgi:hypothetical protein